MEMREFVEFQQFKNTKVALQFEVEAREYDRFKKPFKTDKYITLNQWEEIIGKLGRFVSKQMKLKEVEQLTSKKEHFVADETLLIEFKVLPKSQSYVNFSKLKFEYTLGWILSVSISRLYERKEDKKPELAPKSQPYEISSSASNLETDFSAIVYSPIQLSQYSPAKVSGYTPSNSKQQGKPDLSPEYSPRSSGAHHPESSYTPSKIINNNGNHDIEEKPAHNGGIISSELSRDLFGTEDEDEDYRPKTPDIVISEPEQKPRPKRRLAVVKTYEQQHVPSKVRSHKKIKINASSETLDKWISVATKPQELPFKQSSAKKASSSKTRNALTTMENKSPLDSFDEEKMKKMDDFIVSSKQREQDEQKRREELQDYELYDCNDMSKEELKRYIVAFLPKIFELYKDSSTATLKKGNAVFFTTSNILTEQQVDFVLKEIESHRTKNDRGCQEDVLTDVILPEFILNIFSKRFSLSYEAALERLKLQEEKRILHNIHDDVSF